MKIVVTSVLVDDQAKAHRFYTEILGFQTKRDIDMGEHRWLTVVSPEDPDGPAVLLEPDSQAGAKAFKDALANDGIPWTSFGIGDCRAEYDRLLKLGVTFTQPPTEFGPVITAVFDDTCGNLIQMAQQVGAV
jgi:predicted enzyme related to lactoylglutathione lyase